MPKMNQCEACGKTFASKPSHAPRFCSWLCWRGTPEQRFWNKVSRRGDADCWVWKCATMRFGYGNFYWRGRGTAAHRVSWELHNGPIPVGSCVLHRCDNPPCVNPTHLFLGTIKDNYDDMMSKGRWRCRNPHHPKGMLHPAAKLTDGDVRAIRAARAAGETYQSIGARFGVTWGAARNAALGRSWSHVA